MENYTVYILKCIDNRLYVGYTKNLEKRLKRHAKGEINFTSHRLPVSVVTSIEFSDKYKAIFFEKYLKTGSGRAFMYKRLI